MALLNLEEKAFKNLVLDSKASFVALMISFQQLGA